MSWTFKIVNGDFVRTTYNNGYEEIEDLDKLKQDVSMVLTTSIRVSTGLGCGLDEVIGKDTMNPVGAYMQFPAIFEFQNRVQTGLSRLRVAQRNYLVGFRSSKERIFEFSPVQIWPLAEDPRNYRWRVDVLSEEGTSVAVGGLAKV